MDTSKTGSATVALTNASNAGAVFSVQVTPDDSTLLLASFDTCVFSGSCTAVSNGGLYTYSLSAPSAPEPMGHAYHIDSNALAEYYHLAYSSAAKTAFVVNADGYLQAFDVADVSSPAFVSEVSVGAGNQALSVALSLDQKTAYVADSSRVLSQFDVSAPLIMTLNSNAPIGSQAWSTVMSPDGQQLLLFNQGWIQAMDLSSGISAATTDIGQNPVMLNAPNASAPGVQITPALATGTYIGDRTVVLVGPAGATLVDLTDPAKPVIQGSVAFAGTPSVPGLIDYAAYYAQAKGVVYIVAGNNFYVLNVSNPANVSIVASAALPANPYGSNAAGMPASISATSDGSNAYVVSAGQLTILSIP